MVTLAPLMIGRFVPRLFAGFGVLASLGAIVGASSIYLAPALSDLMFPAYSGYCVAGFAKAFIVSILPRATQIDAQRFKASENGRD